MLHRSCFSQSFMRAWSYSSSIDLPHASANVSKENVSLLRRFRMLPLHCLRSHPPHTCRNFAEAQMKAQTLHCRAAHAYLQLYTRRMQRMRHRWSHCRYQLSIQRDILVLSHCRPIRYLSVSFEESYSHAVKLRKAAIDRHSIASVHTHRMRIKEKHTDTRTSYTEDERKVHACR